jgi:hypothetical protein
MSKDKMELLIEKCKYSVSLTVNSHRDNYESVEEWFNSNPIQEDFKTDIEPEVYEKMKELDTIVELQIYPTSAVGFYLIFHYNLELALDKALETFK